MTVAYNDRTLPLALHASNPDLTTALNISWDFTGFDAAHADGVPWISPAAATFTKTGTINSVTRNGVPGRHMDVNATWYKITGTAGLNLQTGTGDLTIAALISMPVAAPTVTGAAGNIFTLYGTSGKGLSLEYGNVNGTGGYVQVVRGASTVIAATAPNYLLAGRMYLIIVRRVGSTLSLHQVDLSNNTYKLQGTNASFSGALDAAYAADAYAGWVTNADCDIVIHSITHWNAALSDAVIQGVLANDYWSMNANNAAASTIVVTSPAAGATIGQTATISGISAGTVPSGVEVQFNGGTWIALTGFSYDSGSGVWSGVAAGMTPGTGNLVVRKSNETATQSSAVSGVTVSSDAISLSSVPNYRVFQRSLATNQADIALSGTYSGTVTGIEWRFGAGAWTALTSPTIAAGNWSGVATGVPMGSGSLQVRFANNTAVMASATGVGVGDIWICAGQSNMQGRGPTANSYTPSNGLLASKFTHDYSNAPGGSWANLTDPYDALSPSQGSYIPLLATKVLASGVPVAFVPCAIGGTDIISWQKGGVNYNNMLARFNAIGGQARGMLWHQGESDVNNGMSTATHQGYLNQLVNDWYADTGLATVIFRTHEGGPGTLQQHIDIRESQTLVGTNNPHAVLGPDLWGIEPTDVHFLTTVQLQQVVDRAWPHIAAAFYGMRKAVETLVNDAGSPLANQRNIRYAFFDQSSPATFAAPTAVGGGDGFGAVTDANGVIELPLPTTALTVGQTGFLVLSDTSGSAASGSSAFAAPVVVS